MRLPSPIKFATSLLIVSMLFAANPIPARASLSIAIAVSFGPPAIPYYNQPPCPDPNWIWEPGYWSWDPVADAYYWVPGTWVQPPEYGLYWTPGYWAWDDGNYVWYQGYWAPEVGYYGGIDYGYGYYGNGYVGGRWQGDQFAYNTAITNVNRHAIHATYSSRAGVARSWNRVSYNGGRGGVDARPTRSQLAVQHMRHVDPTNVQVGHEHAAMANRANFASVNHGRPRTAAVSRPLTTAGRSTSQHRAVANQQQHRAGAAAANQQQHRAAAANQQQHRAAAANQQQHRAAAANQQQHRAAAANQHNTVPPCNHARDAATCCRAAARLQRAANRHRGANLPAGRGAASATGGPRSA